MDGVVTKRLKQLPPAGLMERRMAEDQARREAQIAGFVGRFAKGDRCD